MGKISVGDRLVSIKAKIKRAIIQFFFCRCTVNQMATPAKAMI